MADLPDVVLSKIFGLLSISERLRVRSTCKSWKFVIETYNSPQSLCIYHIYSPYKPKWCFSDLEVTKDEMVNLNHNSEIICNFQTGFFRNLQKVYLYHIGEKINLLLEAMSYLTKLRLLKIKEGILKLKTLSSSSLERLQLKCVYFDSFELNTSNLSSLILCAERPREDIPLLIRFPLTIKYLECVQFNRNLSELKNLKTLVCQRIACDFRLEDFKSLTKLEIWPTESQLPMARRIQQERMLLKRKDLELIVSGFKVSGLEKGDLFSCTISLGTLELSQEYLELVKRNCSNFFGCAPWKTKLELATFVQHAGGGIPDDFFVHFPKLNCIFNLEPFQLGNSGVSHLIELLKRSNTTTFKLQLFSMNLTQEFYDNLVRVESMRKLIINFPQHLNFSFDCLLNLKNLKLLWIGANSIEFEFICKMVKQWEEVFHFHFGSHTPAPFHLDISVQKRSEFQNVVGCPFSLYVTYKKDAVSVSEDCRDVNELVIELKKLRENKFIRSFFV